MNMSMNNMNMNMTMNMSNNFGRGAGIRDYKKAFYRAFIRNLKVRGYSMKIVEQALGSMDVQNL
jgi:hypothetical protein